MLSPPSPEMLPNTRPRDISYSPQKGMKITEVVAIIKAPPNPANVPVKEIPPLVPGGTSRKIQEVRSLGLLLESIPSSEEKVSAVTAA